MDFLFHLSAVSVLPFWVLMILMPKSEFTTRVVQSPWIILPPTLCYLAFLLPNLPAALASFDGASPQSLAEMMAEPWAASLFWAYAGAFDLFVGRWIFFDARERGISIAYVSPLLFVCILFGPLAFFLYALTRAVFAARQQPVVGS